MTPTEGKSQGVEANGTMKTSDSKNKKTLAQNVEEALQSYFDYLDGQASVGLYNLVITEVEAPLLKTVLARVGGNQSKAAEILGLNRGTLRKKLMQHGLK